MSNQEQESDQRGLRKSKRQRVPNPYYTAGINQLRKISLKGQSKKNRTDQDDYYSSDQDKNNPSCNYRNADSLYSNQKNEQPGTWLPCVLSNKRSIKVQIVIDSAQMEVVKIKQELVKPVPQPIILPSYNSGTIKKPQTSPYNLLSLFQQAIKNVSDVVPSPVKNINNQSFNSVSLEQPVLKYQQSNQKPSKMAILAPPPKRVIEQDKDGKILSLDIDKSNRLIRIKHSKMGICQLPIQVEPPAWKYDNTINTEDSQSELLEIKQLRAKLQLNPLILKGIPIFN